MWSWLDRRVSIIGKLVISANKSFVTYYDGSACNYFPRRFNVVEKFSCWWFRSKNVAISVHGFHGCFPIIMKIVVPSRRVISKSNTQPICRTDNNTSFDVKSGSGGFKLFGIIKLIKVFIGFGKVKFTIYRLLIIFSRGNPNVRPKYSTSLKFIPRKRPLVDRAACFDRFTL